MERETWTGIACNICKLAVDKVIEILGEIDDVAIGKYSCWKEARLSIWVDGKRKLIRLTLTPSGFEDRRTTYELEEKNGSNRLVIHDSPLYLLVATGGETIEATPEIKRVFQALSDLPSIS